MLCFFLTVDGSDLLHSTLCSTGNDGKVFHLEVQFQATCCRLAYSCRPQASSPATEFKIAFYPIRPGGRAKRPLC